jgi:hypothetical protein
MRLLTFFPTTVSGLSAAHTIYLSGGNVVLLDKNSKSFDSFSGFERPKN